MSGNTLARHGSVAPGRPDWKRAPSVEFSFKTTVVTSRDGTEQRSAIRNTARVAMTVELLAWGPELHRVKADLLTDPLTKFHYATAWRQTALATDAMAAADSITVAEVPFWLVAGCPLVLRTPTDEQAVKVVGVAGSAITLDAPVAVDMLAGAKVYHAYTAPFEDSVSFKAVTAGIFSGAVTANAVPGSDPQPTPALALDVFEGDVVFPHKPNWRDRPQIKIGQGREVFDPGSGLIDEFSPTGHTHIDARFLFSKIGAAEAEKLIGFWVDRKGKRGQFRVPTFVQDFDVTQVEIAGTSTFRVRGEDFLPAYRFSDTYNVVALRGADNSLELQRIASMSVVGGDTEITFTQPWSQAITPFSRLHWCPLSRFGSDKLRVEWETAELADMTMTFKTLREET
jgi:hypothetical protein